MPEIHSLSQTMKNHVNEFHSSATIFRPNKFLVGFYGEYVDQAMEKLILDSEIKRTADNMYRADSGSSKRQKDTDVHQNALNKWMKHHYNAGDSQVELKWGCSEVHIPSIQPETESGFLIDSIKSIAHPLVTKHGAAQQVTIEIMEDRNMMFYQFFNALTNRFFTPQILKPRSSIHKLGMYIAVLQGDYVIPQGTMENGTQRDEDLDVIISQIFEFNSIVPKGIPELNFSNDIKQPLKYSLKFDCPNAFQGSFNTSFKGLRNDTSDRAFLSGVDQNGVDKTGQEYVVGNFEVSKKMRMTPVNGVYEKTTRPE